MYNFEITESDRKKITEALRLLTVVADKQEGKDIRDILPGDVSTRYIKGLDHYDLLQLTDLFDSAEHLNHRGLAGSVWSVKSKSGSRLRRPHG